MPGQIWPLDEPPDLVVKNIYYTERLKGKDRDAQEIINRGTNQCGAVPLYVSSIPG
jgi:hypothetical protein